MKNESFARGTCLPGPQLTTEKHLALRRNRVDIFPQQNDLYPLPSPAHRPSLQASA